MNITWSLPGVPRALALSLVLAAGSIPAAHAEASAALERLVGETMRAQQIPGMTLAVMQADRLTYSKAFGSADLENAVPATTETLLRIGSIAKPITAVAAMTLVEAGKLDLDTPVQTYCAPFPPRQWPITTRELLSHTAGIRHYREREMENTQHYRFMADGFAIFAADPLLFQPGSGYSYSTYGYTVVGCAIEGAAGARFQDYVAEHVLKPAGMMHTFVDDVFDIVPHRARFYQKVNGQVKNASLMDSSYKIPGGGYLSTAEDLVRFAQALYDDKLLKAASLSAMWVASAPSGTASYGLGFQILEGGKFVLHRGGQPGTTTQLIIAPRQHVALAVLANMDNLQLDELVRNILRQMDLPSPAPAQMTPAQGK